MAKVGFGGIDRTDPLYWTEAHGDGHDPRRRVPTGDVGGRRRTYPQGGGHPFYERLNQILNAAGFDAFVEQLCAPFSARMGRPSLAPGRYFRLLLVGYFEGLDSERGDCVACGRFVESAVVPASGAAGGAARPLDDLRGDGGEAAMPLGRRLACGPTTCAPSLSNRTRSLVMFREHVSPRRRR